MYPDLERVINNRRWQRRCAPFPHFVAVQVFKPWFYERLECTFNQLLSQGFNSSAHTFARRMSNYDAYSLNIEPWFAGPLNIFVSPAWCDMLATLTGVATTPHVNAVMHHHSAGSSNGRVHTDLNPAWFLDHGCADRVQLPQHAVCNYKTGIVTSEGPRSREAMRAIAMLFYLSNGRWERGDGGETGLYRSRRDPVGRNWMLRMCEETTMQPSDESVKKSLRRLTEQKLFVRKPSGIKGVDKKIGEIAPGESFLDTLALTEQGKRVAELIQRIGRTEETKGE